MTSEELMCICLEQQWEYGWLHAHIYGLRGYLRNPDTPHYEAKLFHLRKAIRERCERLGLPLPSDLFEDE